MSPRFALVVAVVSWGVAVTACSDAGDDECPDCREHVGGSVTFPPMPPTTGGPEPIGGSTSTGGLGSGGVAGTDIGGGGVVTGGVAGTDTGGLGGTTGGVLSDGGTGAFGNQGGDLAGGVFTGGTLTGGFGGTF